MKMLRLAATSLLAALSFVLALTLTAAPAQAQATRTWVSGVGDDANPCSRTAPCKTFAGAISKTAAGGEINCLDPGGFGAVTITKSITIDCEDTQGSILASGTNGVNINDSATGTPNTIRVILRGLSINGAGTTTGLSGVSFTSGASLYMEKVIIQNFRTSPAVGLRVAPLGAAKIALNDVTIVNCGTGATGGGIRVQPQGANGNARVTLTNVRLDGNAGDALRVDATSNTFVGANVVDIANSVISNNSAGITAVTGAGTAQSFVNVTNSEIFNNPGTALAATGTANSLIRASGNTITQNGFGTSTSGGGQIVSYGDNRTVGNSNPATFTGAVLVEN